MKKRKTKKRSGVRLLLCLLLAAALAGAGDRKAGPAAYALLTGTVFRDTGFALPGAEVTAEPVKSAKKAKPLKAATDRRGEFAIRVAPASGDWKITARADGFASVEKTVTVTADERLDVYIELKAAK